MIIDTSALVALALLDQEPEAKRIAHDSGRLAPCRSKAPKICPLGGHDEPGLRAGVVCTPTFGCVTVMST